MTRLPAIAFAALVALSAPAFAAEVVSADTVWSGVVRVDGVVEVEQGATLTIMPGTAVMFASGEEDDEGLCTTGMVVRGAILAEGTEPERISFTSAETGPAPGYWGEVRILDSAGSRFVNCDFSNGGWGLHVHDSKILVKGCTFSDNSFGGVRGKGGEVEITGSRISGMELGIRYWQGAPYIHGNTITGNVTGVFFRQDCDGVRLENNNIYSNHEYDLKLGDAQSGDVNAANNWWGTADVAAIREKIFDKDRESYIGRAVIDPVLNEAAPAGSGHAED